MIVLAMVQIRVETAPAITRSPLRLRNMVESWERQGLITPEVAAPLLRRESRAPKPRAKPPYRARVLERVGYLGAGVVLAAGILLTIGGGTGPLLLAGSLAMVAIRPHRPIPRRPYSPRHRADPPPRANRVHAGPRAYEVVLNGRSASAVQPRG